MPSFSHSSIAARSCSQIRHCSKIFCNSPLRRLQTHSTRSISDEQSCARSTMRRSRASSSTRMISSWWIWMSSTQFCNEGGWMGKGNWFGMNCPLKWRNPFTKENLHFAECLTHQMLVRKVHCLGDIPFNFLKQTAFESLLMALA